MWTRTLLISTLLAVNTAALTTFGRPRPPKTYRIEPQIDYPNSTNKIWADFFGNGEVVLFYINPDQPDVSERAETNADIDTDKSNASADCNRWTPWADDQDRDRGSFNHRNHIHLKITKMQKNEFPSKIFQHFCILRGLALNHANLSDIRSEYFENADHLRHLDLSHNKISRIDAKTFANLKMLDSIDLSFNRIEFIDDHAFDHQNLISIYLQDNKLTTIDWQQFQPLPLKELSFNSVQLDVDYFDVSNNPWQWSSNNSFITNGMDVRFDGIGIETVVIFSKMRYLHASNNRITEIVLEDDSIPKYELVTLKMAHNLLTSVSKLAHLAELEIIDLSYNLLETLDVQVFGKMNRLWEVLLSHNKLKNQDFGYLLNTAWLVTLDVSYNNLGSFTFRGFFPELQRLYIEGNNLTVLDRNWRKVAPELNELGLNDNSWNCDYLTDLIDFIESDKKLDMVRRAPVENWSVHNYNGTVAGFTCFVFDNGEAVPSPGEPLGPLKSEVKVNGSTND